MKTLTHKAILRKKICINDDNLILFIYPYSALNFQVKALFLRFHISLCVLSLR